jgi:hypothetical protein
MEVEAELVFGGDRPAQQFMSKRAGSTVVESRGSHSVYVSQPGAVAALIETAAGHCKPRASP